MYIGINFRTKYDAEGAVATSEYWPVEKIIDRGYATAAFPVIKVAADNKNAGFSQGVFPAVQPAKARGGAKLNHIDLPKSEHIDFMIRVLHHWFCGNYRKYGGKEMEMPFDQHEMLALIAPRLLCVGSATEDHWCGPLGEWWSAKLASPAWELYGKKGLVGDKWPDPEKPQQEGSVSYHLRTGKHFLTPYDWDRYMDFADKHGWRP